MLTHTTDFCESEEALQLLYLIMICMDKDSLQRFAQKKSIQSEGPRATLIKNVMNALFSHKAQKLDFIKSILLHANSYTKYRNQIKESFYPRTDQTDFFHQSDKVHSALILIMNHYFSPHIDTRMIKHIADRVFCNCCRPDRTCAFCIASDEIRRDAYDDCMDNETRARLTRHRPKRQQRFRAAFKRK